LKITEKQRVMQLFYQRNFVNKLYKNNSVYSSQNYEILYIALLKLEDKTKLKNIWQTEKN
jgi:hypothetical protein